MQEAMNQKRTIAVIIPTYNRSALLREAIDSVLAQSYRPNQIIVVNDGSIDDTSDIVASYGDKLTYISKVNGGKAKAMNAGMACCRSDYILICDDDDLLPPEALSRLVEALDANPAAGFVYGDYLEFQHEDPQRMLFKQASYARTDEPNVLIRFLEGMFTSLNTCLVRASLYQEVGGFREDLVRSQDYDMAIRLARKGSAVHVPHVVYHVRQHGGVRGSATVSFSENERDRKWMEYEGKVLSELRKEMDIQEFTPTVAKRWEATLAKRAAYLERASVSAHRGLWVEVVEDLQEANDLSDEAPSKEELALFLGAAGNTLCLTLLLQNTKATTAMRAGCLKLPYVKSVVHEAFGALPWHMKRDICKGEISGAVLRLRLMLRIFGWSGTVKRLLRAIVK